MGTGGTKVKIGPTTRVDLGYPDILGYGLYYLHDFLSLQEAVDTVPSGKTLVIDHDITLTSTINITKPINIISNGDYTIYQSTVDATCFDVKTSNCTFDNIIILGNNGGITNESTSNPYPYNRDKCAFFILGSAGNNKKNITIKNCHISNFQITIFAVWNENFVFDNNTVTNTSSGVFFGCTWIPPVGNPWVETGGSNSNTSLSYRFTNNFITCTHGDLKFSRPFRGMYCSGNVECTNNKLRGGGMAFENFFSDLTIFGRNDILVNFSHNDCDTGVSFANIIVGNHFDMDNAPVGRGGQTNWWQAIEPSNGATITNNYIKNYVNGIGFCLVNCTIADNYFEGIGSTVNGQTIGGGAVIIHQNDTILNTGVTAAPGYITPSNLKIVNNVFKNIVGGIGCIGINIPGWQIICDNILVNGNSAVNCSANFLSLCNVTNAKVINNYVYNSCNDYIADLNGNPWWPSCSILSTQYVDVYYDNNTIISSEPIHHASIFFVAPSGTSIFGYNEVSGSKYGTYWHSNGYIDPTPRYYTNSLGKYNGQLKPNYRTNAGTPSGVLTPRWIGEQVLDTSNNNFYVAYSTANNTSWKVLT